VICWPSLLSVGVQGCDRHQSRVLPGMYCLAASEQLLPMLCCWMIF
jgi:hypothetical protein